jgi:hypothetical protein
MAIGWVKAVGDLLPDSDDLKFGGLPFSLRTVPQPYRIRP